MFQSTRPRGTRLGNFAPNKSYCLFQSTRPRGTRPLPAKFQPFSTGFNPRVREGRDKPIGIEYCRAFSFQSTRPRGTRRSGFSISLHALAFQSTRPRGTRHGIAYIGRPHYDVSIHASARDATGSPPMPQGRHCVSIHASARDATPKLRTSVASSPFQSTRPRGTRLRSDGVHLPRYLGFNPRVREGRDAAFHALERASASFNPRVREGRDYDADDCH